MRRPKRVQLDEAKYASYVTAKLKFIKILGYRREETSFTSAAV